MIDGLVKVTLVFNTPQEAEECFTSFSNGLEGVEIDPKTSTVTLTGIAMDFARRCLINADPGDVDVFQVYRNDVQVHQIPGRTMPSVYQRFELYCHTQGATIAVECDEDESYGFQYWTDGINNFYLREVE